MNYKRIRVEDFLRQEHAAEVTELGIVLALLVAGSVATIILIGPKITQYFSNLNSSLP